MANIKAPSTPSATIDLDALHKLCPRLSKRWAGYMGEASAICLEHHDHKPGLTMTINGDRKGQIKVTWQPLSGKAKASHADMQDATEDGATGVACGLVSLITEHTVIERSIKGTGFDYWCGSSGNLFQKKERLEISGILDGSTGDISSRVNVKVKQVERSNNHLPAIIIVVEFSRPLSQVARKQ